MDLKFSAADTIFREEVREFFATEYPRELVEKIRRGEVITKDDQIKSQRSLQSRRWFAVNWPAEYGGPGLTPTQRYIFEEEMDRAGALPVIPMAVIYVGPVIYTFGSSEQKQQWLPDILESRAFWAQGYSEPESGSDLASLKTRAVRDGDHYIVSGSKIWTTLAQWADWIFCLVRTSDEPRRQDGISFLCFRMDSPGVTVLPIISIDGQHHLNRVHFDNVRVPVANRIGEEGRGWHYAQFLLTNERLSYAHTARKKQQLSDLHHLAANTSWQHGTMADNAIFMHKVAACDMEVAAFEITVLRALSSMSPISAAMAGAIKILATELAQRITELFIELAGMQALPWLDRSRSDWIDAAPGISAFAPLAAVDYFAERAQSIYGGTNEIQRNIIARSLIKTAGG